MTKLKDLWYTIRIEEAKKARTGIGGAVCVDDEFESAMRFAEHYHTAKVESVTDEINKRIDSYKKEVELLEKEITHYLVNIGKNTDREVLSMVVKSERTQIRISELKWIKQELKK